VKSKPRKRPSLAPRAVSSEKDWRELQRLMTGVLFTPLTPGNNMQRRFRGRPMREVAASFIKPNDRLTSFERLEIYNRQYWFRILDGLYEDFPGLRSVLGEAAFMRLAEAYLAKNPSTSFSMRNLGHALEKFIRANPRYAGRRLALALDMVRLEWAQIEAFDNEALPALTSDDFLDTPLHRLRVRLQPHVMLVQADYPVDNLVLAAKRVDSGMRGEASNAMDEATKHAPQAAIPLPKREPLALAVHRHDNMVYFKRLEPEAFAIVKSLRDGAPVTAACEKALRRADPSVDWATKVRLWFSNWAQLGWFCRRE
jgi:Putative DNA-binding domain